MSKQKPAKILKDVANWWLDIDGTVYCGHEAVPGAAEAIQKMREMAKVTFVTNVTTHSPETLAKKLVLCKIDCAPEEIYNAGSAAISWIKKKYDADVRLVVDGTPDFKRQLRDAGLKIVNKKPDLAVIAFNRQGNKIIQDGRVYDPIYRGCDFIATHDNINVPTGGGNFMMDTGAILAGIRASIGKEPLVICGKPYEAMYEGLMEHTGEIKGKTAMVGDGAADMKFANNNKLLSVFVKTGGMTADDMKNKGVKKLDVVWDSIADFGK